MTSYGVTERRDQAQKVRGQMSGLGLQGVLATQISSKGIKDISFPNWRKRSFHVGQGQGRNTHVVTVGNGTVGEEQRSSDFPSLMRQGRGFRCGEQGSALHLWGEGGVYLRLLHCSGRPIGTRPGRGWQWGSSEGYEPSTCPKHCLSITVLRNQWWTWREGLTSKRKGQKLWTWPKSTVNRP